MYGLFNLDGTTKRLVIVFVIIFALGLFGISKCAHSAEPYVQISAGSTYIRGPAQVLDLSFTWKAPQQENAFWKTSMTIVGDSDFHGQKAPNNLMLRGEYVTGFGHFDVGLGLCWIAHPYPYNGQPMNFSLEMAYRFQRYPVTLTLTHCSDAGMQMPNYGRDLVTLGWRFK
ncbi:MAG: hypothetical protein JSR92_20170 [Proteobacteria bacterium]|nr:hypothetical protein [Pseudomonadota bacterium]